MNKNTSTTFIEEIVLKAMLLFLLFVGLLLIVFSKDYSINSIIIIFWSYIMPSYFIMFLSIKKKFKKMNFYSLFLILSFFFFYGHFFLISTGFSSKLELEYISVLSSTLLMENVVKAEVIFMVALLTIIFFACLMHRKENNCFKNKKTFLNVPQYCALIAKIVFIVSAICVVVSFINEIGFDSYVAKRDFEREYYIYSSGSILFYVKYFSKWFIPTSYLLLILYGGKNKKLFFAWSIPIVFYCVFYLLTGQRYEIIQIATAVIIIYFFFYPKFKIKTVIILIPLLIVGIIAMTAISYIRVDYANRSLSSYFALLGTDFAGQVFYSIFYETGTTSCSLINTIQHCPSDINHGGFDFIVRSLLICLPSSLNPDTTFSATTISSMFSPFMYGGVKSGYGSSFVTEAYYYFGNCMYLYFVVLGFAISKIVKKMNCTNNVLTIFISVYVLSELSFCIRSDLTLIFRNIIYYCLIPSLVIVLASKYNKRININTAIPLRHKYRNI